MPIPVPPAPPPEPSRTKAPKHKKRVLVKPVPGWERPTPSRLSPAELRGRAQCSICCHPERLRIDFLICSGAVKVAVARQFHLSNQALARHATGHITDELKSTLLSGPFGSEEKLRQLVADSGSSVFENLRAVYGALAKRFLVAFERGDDRILVSIAKELHENLSHQARLSGELLPPQSITNNFLLSPDWFQNFSEDLLALVRRHPQIRDDLAELLRHRLGLPMPGSRDAIDLTPEPDHAEAAQ